MKYKLTLEELKYLENYFEKLTIDTNKKCNKIIRKKLGEKREAKILLPLRKELLSYDQTLDYIKTAIKEMEGNNEH